MNYTFEKVLQWTTGEKQILYSRCDGKENVIGRIVIDIELERKITEHIWDTIFNEDNGSPAIFLYGETTFIVTHGRQTGYLVNWKEVFGYINAFPREKIKVICCYPGRVRKRYPRYSKYIFGDWDEVLLHGLYNSEIDTKKYRRLISSVIIKREKNV